VMTRYYDSLGGAQLTFVPPPGAPVGLDGMQLYENPLVYNQDGLFIGGGPYWQATDWLGVGVNYVQAVWYRNLANIKTVVLSLSFSPPTAKPPPPEESIEPMPEQQVEPEPAAPGPAAPAPAEPGKSP
jgi:hypothetical protein